MGKRLPDESAATELVQIQKAMEMAREYSRLKGGKGKVIVEKGHVNKVTGKRGYDHVHAIGRDGERLPGHFWFGKVGMLSLLLDILDANGNGEFDPMDLLEWANPNPFNTLEGEGPPDA